MKKIFIPMLALAVLASCSKSENNSDARTAISLGADVKASTKAPIVEGSNVNAGIAGWENNSAADYSVAPTWSTDITTTAHPTDGKAVTWTDQKYYNADATYTTYMKAWYPKGTLTGSSVSFTNTTGDQDVLLAPVVSGSKTANSSKTLAFAHKTAQLTFYIKKGAGLADGTTLSEIEVKDVQLPVGFDLTKADTENGAVVYSEAAPLKVQSIAAEGIAITSTDAKGEKAGNPMMIKPQTGKKLILNIKTNKADYADKEVEVSTENIQEGYSYAITLTFGQAGIEVTATIAQWQDATGSGDII